MLSITTRNDERFGARDDNRNPLLIYKAYTPQLSPAEIKDELNAYDGAIAYLDYHIDQLFQELQRRNELENTLVIITSDHGEEFGEHGFLGHGNTLYTTALHVPLLIIFPHQVPGDNRVLEPVSLRDIPATVLELLNLESKSTFPGASLSRYWTAPKGDQAQGNDMLLSEEWEMKSLISNNLHYVRNETGAEELYDYEQDPFELQNLAASKEGRIVLQQFRQALDIFLGQND